MKALAATLGLLAAYEGGLAVARFQRRKQVFAQAKARAEQLGRQLVALARPPRGGHRPGPERRAR